MESERRKLEKVCMKNGKWEPMKGRQYVNDIRRGKERKKMRGWRSITPSDGVADWCCCANAELLRNWSLMDGSFAG